MKYPYIGKSPQGHYYLVAKEELVYSFLSKSWLFGPGEFPDLENITREYLANTKIKIESQEHLDFLYELAEGYQLNLDPVECRIFDAEYPYFVTVRGSVFHANINLPELSDKKLITIPLPPKEPEPKEWPQVGDEVLTANNYPLTVKGIDGIYAWCLDNEGDYLTFAISELKKPLTPEEELATLISNWRGQDKATIGDSNLAKAIINGEIKGVKYEQ